MKQNLISLAGDSLEMDFPVKNKNFKKVRVSEGFTRNKRFGLKTKKSLDDTKFQIKCKKRSDFSNIDHLKRFYNIFFPFGSTDL